MAQRKRRSDRLLEAIEGYDNIVVVTHDNPDPDAIATGWAIAFLIREKTGKPVRLVGGGEIVRAENRHMLKLLKPPIELVPELEVPDGTAAILVDCGDGAGNHLLSKDTIEPVAVVDHHPVVGRRRRLRFRDVRTKVAASASIAGSYLREQKLEPPKELATALLYAIRSETSGSETYYSWLDRSLLTWLTPRSTPSQLAEIINAPLSRDYYSDLVLALQNTFVYDEAALCLLPRASGPEIVGEVADLLIRGEGIERVLCGAIVGKALLVSVRTEQAGDDAAELLRTALRGLGHGGGHEHRAGGKIPHSGNANRITADLQERIRTQWLDACRVDHKRGVRLIPRREIVEHL